MLRSREISGRDSSAVAMKALRTSPIVVVAVIFAVTLICSLSAHYLIRKENQINFEKLVADAESEVLRRFYVYEQALWGGVGLFYATDYTSRKDWARYVRSLNFDNNLKGLNGLGFIEYVERGNVDDFLHQTRSDGAPYFQIHPNTDFHDKFVIKYIEPLRRNKEALGLDIGFENNRREAAILAQKTGKAALTRRIELVQDPNKKSGFLMLLPVYQNPEDLNDKRLRGWVYAPLMISDVLDGISEISQNQLYLRVYDGAQVDPADLIYEDTQGDFWDEAPRFSKITVQKVTSAGSSWTMQWQESPQFKGAFVSGRLAAFCIFLFGFCLAAISCLYLKNLSKKRFSELSAEELRLVEQESLVSARQPRIQYAFFALAILLLSMLAGATLIIQNILFLHNQSVHSDAMWSGRHQEILDAIRIAENMNNPAIEVMATGNLTDQAERYNSRYSALKGHMLDISQTAKEDAQSDYGRRMVRQISIVEIHLDKHALKTKRVFEEYRKNNIPLATQYMNEMEKEHGLVLEGLTSLMEILEQARGDISEKFYSQAREIERYKYHAFFLFFIFILATVIYGIFVAIRSKKIDAALRLGLVKSERAQDEIRAQEVRLRSILDSTVDGIVTIDMRGNITRFSKSAEKIFGYHAQEVLGRNVSILMPESEAQHHQGYIERYIETGVPTIIGSVREAMGKRKNGDIFPLEFSVNVISQKEEIGFTGVLRDISARKEYEAALKESEERYSIAIEGSNDGIWDWDLKNDEVFYSPRLRELLGYEGDDFKNFPNNLSSIQSHFHPDDWDIISDGLEAHFERNEAYDIEPRVRVKMGYYKHFRIRGKAFRDKDGEPVRMAGSITDISDIKKAQENLALALSRAEKATQAKSEFLANMSHEIRTPLNGVMGTADLLLATDLDEKQKKYLQIITASAKTLLGIINEILDFSKIEAGKFEIHPKPMMLGRAVEEMMAMLMPLANEKDISLDFSYDPDIPEFIIGDEIRIKQIITNLVGNALKFTEAGGSVTVTVSPTEFEHEIKVSVRDTGIGIPEDKKESIFSAFSQIHSNTGKKTQGTGLGLSICKSLAEMMGGRVGLESETGAGSLFWFTFSYLPPTTKQIEDLSVEMQEIQFTDQALNLRVLVVEDVATNQFVIMDMLEGLGCEVEIANNGRESLKMIEKNDYSLVLMDCQMPIMDGYTATEKIRKMGYGDLPIIALTANALKGDREKCLAAGMNDFISKPVNKKEVRDVILKWTHQS